MAAAEDGRRAGLNTVCPSCRGTGSRYVARMAAMEGEIGTAMVEERCKACGGSGWIDGSVPLG